ncbi:MAG: MlaD family protein [Cyclobacteriaceae bacterium]
MRISKELKVGIISIASLTILYFGFNYLKGINLLSSTNHYFAVYDDTGGLGVSNSVVINGLAVGRVSDITILQNKENKILVRFDVEKSIKMGKGTVAKLANTDFLGSKALDLEVDNDFSSMLQKGDTLDSYIEAGITEFLAEKGAPLAEDLGVTIKNLNLLLSDFKTKSEHVDPAVNDLVEAMASFKYMMKNNEKTAGILLRNINKTTMELNDILVGLRPLLTKANQIADTINMEDIHASLEKTREVLTSFNQTIGNLNDGEGTAGKLLTDDSLYVNLNNTAASLDRLLVDFRERPKRYVHFSVFGRRDKAPKEKKNKD